MGFFEDLLSGIGLIPSDEERNLLRTGQRVSDAEAEQIQQRTRLAGDVEDLIRQYGGQGRPPVFEFDLRNPTDIGEFMEGIQPTGELNALMRLLGSLPASTSAADSASQLGLGLRQRREDNLNDLANVLLMGFGGGGSGGGGAV